MKDDGIRHLSSVGKTGDRKLLCRVGSVRVSISTLRRLGKKARSSLSVLHFL